MSQPIHHRDSLPPKRLFKIRVDIIQIIYFILYIKLLNTLRGGERGVKRLKPNSIRRRKKKEAYHKEDNSRRTETTQ